MRTTNTNISTRTRKDIKAANEINAAHIHVDDATRTKRTHTRMSAPTNDESDDAKVYSLWSAMRDMHADIMSAFVHNAFAKWAKSKRGEAAVMDAFKRAASALVCSGHKVGSESSANLLTHVDVLALMSDATSEYKRVQEWARLRKDEEERVVLGFSEEEWALYKRVQAARREAKKSEKK